MTTPLDQTRAMDEARAAFEADYFGNLPMTSEARSRNGDGYHFSLPQTAWATWWTAWQAAIASRAGEMAEVQALADGWRRLALQFDNHRMTALWHLKSLVQEDDAEARAFLNAPPLSGEQVLADRIAALVATPQDPPTAAKAAKET